MKFQRNLKLQPGVLNSAMLPGFELTGSAKQQRYRLTTLVRTVLRKGEL